MSWFSNLFSGGNNPANEGMPYFQQIPQVEEQYYNPYITQGKNAYNSLSPQLTQMFQDPTGFINKLMEGYEPSQQFKLNDKYLRQNAANTAAAGGYRGNLTDIGNEGDITNRLLSDDEQSYLRNVLSALGMGQQGEEHFYDTGYNASRGLADNLGTNLSNEGQLAFQGQAEKNRQANDWIKMFSGVLGNVLASYGNNSNSENS